MIYAIDDAINIPKITFAPNASAKNNQQQDEKKIMKIEVLCFEFIMAPFIIYSINL